ncbi:hypothetical protein SK128_008989 [Halocaridina rubra]|uniref:NACHT domain-containing protein n=1 Tax=Halocaridina rubra TaxID=373956 RepID=A0AAN9A660_HALRR
MSLFDYLENKIIPIKKLTNSLNSEQIKQIYSDPEGHTFSVSLLYNCIKWTNNRIAHKNSDLWKEGNGSLESSLTEIINRYKRIHSGSIITNWQEFSNEVEDIRGLLNGTIGLTAIRYDVPQNKVTEWIEETNTKLDLFKKKPLPPSDISSFQKQVTLLDNMEMVSASCKKGLLRVSTISKKPCPSFHIPGISFKADIRYIELILGDKSRARVFYENLLEDNIHQIPEEPIIWFEVFAGLGKSYVMMQILHDWIMGQGTMKGLDTYDIILHFACRSDTVKTFEDLITYTIPDIAAFISSHDMKNIILQMKVLVIIDNLNEINESSSSLLQELMQLKRDYHITLIITSRPKFINLTYPLVEDWNYPIKRIYVNGISDCFRDQFIISFHREITKGGYCEPSVQSLLEYLTQNEGHLKYSWCFPFNLMSLVAMWVDNSTSINNITNCLEFYRQVYLMMTDKILHHLSKLTSLKQCTKVHIMEKINDFLYVLGQEALAAQFQGNIYLSQESCHKLEEICKTQELPYYAMLESYLDVDDTQAPKFHHEKFQSFLGALSLCMKLEKIALSSDIEKKSDEPGEKDGASTMLLKKIHLEDYQNFPHTTSPDLNALTEELEADFEEAMIQQYNASKNVNRNSSSIEYDINEEFDAEFEDILKQQMDTSMEVCTQPLTTYIKSETVNSSNSKRTMTEASTVIQDSLEIVKSKASDLTNYMNVLTLLIGLLCSQNSPIYNSFKEEALELLRKTADSKRGAWMFLLDSVKCDEFVISYISNQPNVLEGMTWIYDDILYAYNVLLQALQKLPLRGTEAVFYIELRRDSPIVEKLLKRIIELRLAIRELNLHYYYKDPSSVFGYGNLMHNVLNSCKVNKYIGAITEDMTLPSSIEYINARVTDEASCGPLERFMFQYPDANITICIPPDVNPCRLRPMRDKFRTVCIPYVSEDDIPNVLRIVRTLQPVEGKLKLRYISLHGVSLTTESQLKLVKGLVGAKVTRVVFPEASKPTASQMEEFNEVVSQGNFRVDWNVLSLSCHPMVRI